MKQANNMGSHLPRRAKDWRVMVEMLTVHGQDEPNMAIRTKMTLSIINPFISFHMKQKTVNHC
jgi:hypothetical protein